MNSIQSKLSILLAITALSSLSCAGFARKQAAHSEELIRTGIAGDNAPSWVSGVVQNGEGDSISFVGRGGGSTVLDERHAYDEALDHVRTQVSNYVATRVVAESCMGDSTNFAPHLGNRYLDDDGEKSEVHHR
ncbi:MAG TPA: hypothetical protein EYN86_04600, partial [Planctomycetes bacterium]|nr:hypothetical protein [Planctomycetota bacterium]